MAIDKSSASEIIERLLSSYGVTSQKTLAECLEIPANNISGWIQRDSVPGNSIIKCALDTDTDLRWLMTGKFEKSNFEKKDKELAGKKLYEQILASGGKAVLRRILDAYSFSTQKELADLLGIPTGTISTWIRRDFFPGDVVVTCALDTGVALAWLATGKGIAAAVESDVAGNNDFVTILPKQQLKAGMLEPSGEWFIDSKFLPVDLLEPVFIESKSTSWLVDVGITSISNGRWLLDIDGKHDIYDITLIPGKKINVTNSFSDFQCGVDEVNAVGRVSLTIEPNF
ncbi:CI repressor [Yersinia mollaretii]|uniref:phage repressor protein CI n=1 Tax=Yersinia mollaretii TaxID=33060 RepID=UPI0005DCC4C0|nr:phage repressor protein CI [Yersinia mollaretii]CNJ97127.1 CI repressor [Yersinia mollaretii]